MTNTEERGLRAGHVLALAGALVVLGSLWRPWYAVDIPASLRDALAGEASRASGSVLGRIAQTVAAVMPARIEVDGWDALRGTDVALCVVALAVGALVLGAAGALGSGVRVDRGTAARGLAGIGAVAVAIVARRLLVHPGSGAEVYGLSVDVAQGAWLALTGAAAIALGGALASASPHRGRTRPAPERWPLPEAPVGPAEDRASTSVAPPRT